MTTSQISFVVHGSKCSLNNNWLIPQPGGVRVYAHVWHGAIDIQWDGKTLPVAVYAEAESAETSPVLQDQWTQWIGSGAAIAIQQSALKPFKRNNVAKYMPEECDGTSSPWTVPITAAYLAELEQAFLDDQKGRRSFNVALERARSMGQHSPRPGEKHGPYEMLSFLQWSLDRGDPNPYNRAPGHYSDLEAARSAMSDLSRRKNTRHDGYRSSQESVDWHLTGLHPPTVWCDSPIFLDVELLGGS